MTKIDGSSNNRLSYTNGTDLVSGESPLKTARDSSRAQPTTQPIVGVQVDPGYRCFMDASPAGTLLLTPPGSLNRESKKEPAATSFSVLDDAAIAKLSASGNPADAELAKMLRAARTTYATLIAEGASVSIMTNVPGNGGRPVVAIVPSELVTQPNQPFEVAIHYHGMCSTACNPAPEAQLARKLKDQLSGPPPRVYLLPTPERMTSKAFPIWTSVQNTRQTADAVLSSLGLSASGAPDHPLVVMGHSAGGRAIAAAQANGGLDCERLVLADCLYGVPAGRADSLLPTAWAAAKEWAAQHPDKSLVYVRSREGGNDHDLSASDLPVGTDFRRVVVQHHYDADLAQL